MAMTMNGGKKNTELVIRAKHKTKDLSIWV